MAFPSEQGRTVLAVMWTQTIVALIFVILRLYTRRVLLRNIGLDDHLSWVSMILFLLYTIFVTVAAMYGLGSHATDLTLEQFAMSTKWELMGQTANILAIATSKSSVAVFLIRIVNVNWHKWLLHFSIFSAFFVCVSCVVFMYTQCSPAQGIWDPRVTTVCHINFTANAIFSGAYTAAIDFFLAVFPWFVLWNLKMKRKERLTIAIGLSLGIIAGVCGIVRAVVLERIDAKSDYPHATVPVLIWGSSELLVCLLCATIPALRPFYKVVTSNGSSADQYSSQKKYGSQGLSGNQWQELKPASNTKSSIKMTTWNQRSTAVVKSDGASDESALFKETDGRDILSGAGIKRTTEVDVSYTADIPNRVDMRTVEAPGLKIVVDLESSPGTLPGHYLHPRAPAQPLHPTATRDVVDRGIVSVENARKYHALYQQRLDHFFYGILGDHSTATFEDIRHKSPILSTAVCAVGALHLASPGYQAF
ncbi:putative Integral membrane protein pth11 [Seiridium cardinale]